ncbi:MAG: helix-turn-helix transcriptional regulator [Chloroflexota bacterium]
MQGNDYGDLIASWKVELIGRRARRFGFRTDEIADLEQTIVLELLDAHYDSDLEGGAAERTFVIAVIDRQLKQILRRRKRYVRRVNHEAQSLDAAPPAHFSTGFRPDYQQLRLDTQAALLGLTPTERAICQALSEGRSQADIARQRGCSRAAVCKHIARVADKFRRFGLADYLGGSEK